MKNNYTLDTMALILWLEKRKLPLKVKNIIKDAENDKLKLLIPSMVLAEVGYLSEKNRIETNLKDVIRYTEKFKSVIIEAITKNIIIKTFQIDDIPELHDRIIAATALQNDSILLTNDPIISNSKFAKVCW